MNIDRATSENMTQATKFFQEYSDTIRTTIAIHINDKSSVDDILHDFFLELIKNPVPPKVKNVKAYLNRSVKNDVLDFSFKTKNYHLRNRRYAQMHMNQFEVQSPDNLTIHREEIHQLFNVVQTQLHQYESEAIIQKYRYGNNTAQAAKKNGDSQKKFFPLSLHGNKKTTKLFRQ